MKKLIVAGVLGLTVALPLTGTAFADHNPHGNDSSAPGQAQATANCRETIVKQNAQGVIGPFTGNPKDEKQLPTAVTNCDHLWQAAGSNP